MDRFSVMMMDAGIGVGFGVGFGVWDRR